MNDSCTLAGGTLVSFVTAFLSVWWIYRYVLKIAMEKNIVDNPYVRKLQKEPVPVVGGVAVAFGVIVATFFGGDILRYRGTIFYRVYPDSDALHGCHGRYTESFPLSAARG